MIDLNRKTLEGILCFKYECTYTQKIFFKYYSCIGGYLVAQNTVAENWANAW